VTALQEECLFCRSWPVCKSWPLTSKFWRTLDVWLLKGCCEWPVGLSVNKSIRLDVAPLDGFNGVTRVARGPLFGIFKVGAFIRFGFESSAGPILQRFWACSRYTDVGAIFVVPFNKSGRESNVVGGGPAIFGRPPLCCNSLTRTDWSVSPKSKSHFLYQHKNRNR
jgi:hypothetical protein